MQLQVEKIDALNCKLRVEVPAQDVNVALDKALNNIMKNARIDGFRKGRAPKNVVSKMYASTIIQYAGEDLVKAAFAFAMKEANLNIIDYSPADIEGELARDQVLTVVFPCELEPEYEDRDLSDKAVKLVACEITDADVDKLIESLRQQSATWSTKDGLAFGPSTRADIDFVGKKDGVEFKGGKAEHFMLDFDTSRMIDGFISSIEGHKAGENFDINVKFPDDYMAEELRGADAVFNITIHAVQEKVLPAIDDAFLAKFGCEGKDEAYLRSTVRKNVELNAKLQVNAINQNQVNKVIYSMYEGSPAPKSLVKSRCEQILHEQVAQLPAEVRKHANVKDEKMLALFEAPATEEVIRSLGLSHLLKQYNISTEVDEKVVEELISNDAQMYEDANEYIKSVKEDKRAMRRYSNIATNNHVYEQIIKLMKSESVSVQFEELQKIGASPSLESYLENKDKAQA